MNQKEKKSALISHFKKKWTCRISLLKEFFSVVFFFPKKERNSEIILRIQGEIFKHEDI